MRTAQKDKSANELVDDDGLTAQQRFVAEYLKDNNATAAADVLVTDPNYGRQLITNPNVAQAIAQQQKASIARTLGSADEVLAQMWQLATFDANQLSQYRRGACRYCWGFGHQYQWRDAVEFEEKRLEAKERDKREPKTWAAMAMTTPVNLTLNARAAMATELASLTSPIPGNSPLMLLWLIPA
jgi:hypothetical protein